MWRLFIAVALPPEVHTALTEAQQRLQTAGLRAAWVRPQGMHLTLHFLGDTPVAQLTRIIEACEKAAARVPPFGAAVQGMGCFPNKRRPRVIAARVSGDLRQLRRLHARLGRALTRVGLRLDTRPYRAHVTIGRLRRPPPAAGLAALAQALAEPPASYGTLQVEAIELFRSELRPGGAVYTSLATAPLQGTAYAPTTPTARRGHGESAASPSE